MPDLPMLMIPHPLGGLSLEMVEERAGHAIPQVLQLIQERAA
ncbi:MAG: UGSC family (seleno)protein [Burkholderiales bacterium]